MNTILDTITAIALLDRAGQHTGITAIAKLAGCAHGRAVRQLKLLGELGLVYYGTTEYRPGVWRKEWRLTPPGERVYFEISGNEYSSVGGIDYD